MIAKANQLEEKLNELFVVNAPKLPDGGKKVLVEWAPVISAIVGIFTLYSAWTLWHWARLAEHLVSYANTLCNAYTGYTCGTPVSRYSVWLWLGVLFLAAEGLLFLFAYPGLKQRRKQGWNYLYYGALVNIAYAVISLFVQYDTFSHFVSALIGSAIGFYFLFQIRSAFIGSTRTATATPRNKPKA
jgi:hypothetical protein